MIIAVLFNSDHPSLGNYYSYPIQKYIFNSKILQNANRHLKIGIGDVLFHGYAKTSNDVRRLAEYTLFNRESKWLNEQLIRNCITNSTIFTWVIQNTTAELTDELHNSLSRLPSYLGIHEINFSYPFHLMFFRILVGERYRVIGDSIKVFYSMGGN